MHRTFIILFLSIVSLSGCTSATNTIRKQNRLISQEVFAVNDSLKLGRIDLADKHSDLLVKIVPPPLARDRILIKPFRVTPPPLREKRAESDQLSKLHGKAGPINVDVEGKYFGLPGSELGENIVVLPEALKDKPVIVENSKQYKILLAENKELREQVQDREAKLLAAQSEKTDKILIKKEEIVENAAEKEVIARATLWGRVKFWGVVAACVAGAGLLIYLFPPIIGVSISLLKGVKRILQAIFSK